MIWSKIEWNNLYNTLMEFGVSNIGQETFISDATRLWNRAPSAIWNCKTLHSAKVEIKNMWRLYQSEVWKLEFSKKTLKIVNSLFKWSHKGITCITFAFLFHLIIIYFKLNLHFSFITVINIKVLVLKIIVNKPTFFGPLFLHLWLFFLGISSHV